MLCLLSRCCRSRSGFALYLVTCSAILLSCSDNDDLTDPDEVAHHGETKAVSGYYLPKTEKTFSEGKEVVTTGFEHDDVAGDSSFRIDPLGQVEGATFGAMHDDSIWLACPDRNLVQVGCAGFADVPSPTHGARINRAYKAVIRFDPPVSSVSLLYTAYITNDHVLNAYNGANQLIASAPAPGNDETTSEEPYMNDWDTVRVEVGSDLIKRVEYVGVGVPWLDDLTFTRKARCNDIFSQPPGDPILDRPEVQEALYDALVEGGAFSPDIEARLEEGGWIFERPDGTTYARRTENPLKQSACGLVPGGAFPLDPNDTPIAGYHAHPFSHGDTVPSSCQKGEGATYRADLAGGPSPEDWEDLIFHSGIPHFVIDLDNVYAVQQYVPESQRGDTPRFEWTDATCHS